jgi:predicted ribosome quality control (RQC) complex YloA/Tae2 family protein
MALRKSLGNGKVTNVQQHEFERTVILKIKTKEGEFRLIVELFGEGNIILVSPENRILHALVYKRMRDRSVLRGEQFEFAPPSGRNPFKTSRKAFDELRKFGQLEIVKALTKFLSIGGLYAEEILLRAEVDKNAPCETLGKQELDKIFAGLQPILSSLRTGKIEPRIVIDENGSWIDVVPLRLKKHEHLQVKAYKKFNQAVDEFYMETRLKTERIQAAREFERQLAKLQRVLERQRKALESSERDLKRNKRLGDLIYAHLGELQLLQQRILNERKSGKTWKQIVSELQKEKEKELVPAKYFEAIDPENRVLTVSLEDSTLQLDLTRSVQTVAAKFYERAKKAQKKMEGARKAILETQSKIEQLHREKQQIVKARKPPPVRRERAWYEKFRWFRSSDGFLIIGGKDAATNEILIKKYMEPHDLVFHADIVGAPFVLIKTEGKTPSEQSLREAAQFAASYSRAWREGFGAVDVYWIRPNQVSKSPPSGQHLKKGSFMIRGAKNYLRRVLLGVAIGVQVKDHVKIVGGPPEAIAKHASVYVEIVPGEYKSSELARQIRRILSEKAPEDLKRQILETPLDEIQTFIPSGRGRIKSARLS